MFDDALQDGDLRVRGRAALGASAGALLARLAVEGDRGVRYRIAVGLLAGDVGRDQAVAALERLRGGDDPAAPALGQACPRQRAVRARRPSRPIQGPPRRPPRVPPFCASGPTLWN
ncbi:hypothetical protein [Nonomuraea sp. NPDC005692]|uniref:hypothetical protein n=1 Tax=Nonomuraea sp. NPDC005692 TaxID=3157168 RepID=UPI0033FA1461